MNEWARRWSRLSNRAGRLIPAEMGNTMYGRKWKPSKTRIAEFVQKMDGVQEFCIKNGIDFSHKMDSFYFTVDNQKYRVSNHTVAASNGKAYNFLGEQVRDIYHPNGTEDDVIYITAGKTRLIEVYTNILTGKPLDKRGNIK